MRALLAIAAALVRCVPSRVLGPAVGGLIVLTNARTRLGADALDAPATVSHAVLLGIAVLWLAAVGWSVLQHRSGSHAQNVSEATTADEVAKPTAAAAIAMTATPSRRKNRRFLANPDLTCQKCSARLVPTKSKRP